MKIEIELNGKKIKVQEGITIFDLCRKLKLKIPHLCHHDKLESTGACRLCVVEVNGKIVTSCTTKTTEGQIIRTHSPNVLDARKINLELLLANHDLNCATCAKSLDCRLQRYAKNAALILGAVCAITILSEYNASNTP